MDSVPPPTHMARSSMRGRVRPVRGRQTHARKLVHVHHPPPVVYLTPAPPHPVIPSLPTDFFLPCVLFSVSPPAAHPVHRWTINRRASTSTLCGQLVHTFLCSPRPGWFSRTLLSDTSAPPPLFPSKGTRYCCMPVRAMCSRHVLPVWGRKQVRRDSPRKGSPPGGGHLEGRSGSHTQAEPYLLHVPEICPECRGVYWL